MGLVGDERDEERKGSALGIEQVSMFWFPLFSLVLGFLLHVFPMVGGGDVVEDIYSEEGKASLSASE